MTIDSSFAKENPPRKPFSHPFCFSSRLFVHKEQFSLFVDRIPLPPPQAEGENKIPYKVSFNRANLSEAKLLQTMFEMCVCVYACIHPSQDVLV